MVENIGTLSHWLESLPVDIYSSFCFKHVNNFFSRKINVFFFSLPLPLPYSIMEHIDLLMHPIKTTFCCILEAFSKSKYCCANRGSDVHKGNLG